MIDIRSCSFVHYYLFNFRLLNVKSDYFIAITRGASTRRICEKWKVYNRYIMFTRTHIIWTFIHFKIQNIKIILKRIK